jgi:hypothetical protein
VIKLSPVKMRRRIRLPRGELHNSAKPRNTTQSSLIPITGQPSLFLTSVRKADWNDFIRLKMLFLLDDDVEMSWAYACVRVSMNFVRSVKHITEKENVIS